MGAADDVPMQPIRRGDKWGQVRQACDLCLRFVACPRLSPVCPRRRDWQSSTVARCPRGPHGPRQGDAVFTEVVRPRSPGRGQFELPPAIALQREAAVALA